MQRKPLIYLLISALISIAPAPESIADEPPTIQQLDARLQQGELDAPQYLDAVDDWVNRQFASGIQYHRDTLVKLLSTFRRLAWASDSVDGHRINYYINLSNNANYAARDGESVYFLEKAEQEILTDYGEKPLLVAGRKCNTYFANSNYKNVIAAYEQERAYIEQFPELIRTKAINLNIAASFINVLNPTIQAYAKLRDTTGLDQTLALAEEIYEELDKRWEPLSNTAFTVRFYTKNLYYHKYFSLDSNRQKSREALYEMQHALYGDTTRPATLIGQLTPVLDTKLVEYFLAYQQNDSAAYYLAKLKNTPNVFPDHDFTLNLFEAKLLANQGKYQLAYERAEAAVHDIDSIQSVLVNDIDELLYAHTEAEYNRQALQASEQQKYRRTMWLVAVSVFAIAAMALVYLIIRRREKNTQIQIEKLNNATNIQIAAMEEIKAQAVLDEKKRLARDLHDGLSATLATTKLQLELLATEIQGDSAQKLTDIRNQVEHAYSIARGKSHQWYDTAIGSEEADFKNRLQRLLDSALTDNHYTKEIHIDDHTFSLASRDVRIELLRIVQEAVTNIIKHAKARHVSVLVYREDTSMVLLVSDDGKGIKSTSSNGIGIRSMEDRVQQYGGHLNIDSGADGTQVAASFPLNGGIASS